jgi:hypothetical protein
MSAPIGGDAFTLIAIECQEASGSLLNTGQLGTFAGLSRTGTAAYNQSSLGGLKAVNLFTPSFSFAGNYFNGTASFPASDKWTISLLNKPTNTGGFTWGSVTTGSTWFSNTVNGLTLNNSGSGRYGISASVTLSDGSNPVFQINAVNGPLTSDYILMWMTVDSTIGVITLGYHRTDGVSAPTFGYSVTQSFTPGRTVNWGSSIVWMGDSGVGVQVGSDGDFSHARIENTVRNASYFQTLIGYYQAGSGFSVTSVSPNVGYTGQTVVVNGTSFVAGATVKVGGVAATTTFADSTHLTVTVPPNVNGLYDVVVTLPDASVFTLTNGFSYTTNPNTKVLPLISANQSTPGVRAALRSWLNPVYQGPGWEGVLDALADGDQKNVDNSVAIYNQLHITSSGGKYLDRWGRDYDYPRPFELGMSDEDFRDLLVKITSHKLTTQSFNEVLEIYYGDVATRAHVASAPGPWVLSSGDDLSLSFEERTSVKIFFNSADFQNIALATPREVCDVINRYLAYVGYQGWADVFYDGLTQQSYVWIYSAALGMNGSVRVTGGKAQNAFEFATALHVPYTVPTTWTVSTAASQPNYMRWSMSTSIDLSVLRVGDYVNVYGAEFNAANRGSFPIKTVGATYFEIQNPTGVTQSAVQPNLAANFLDVVFYRPSKQTLNTLVRKAFAVQSGPATTKVLLPVTSSMVKRNTSNASYFQPVRTFTIVSCVVASQVATITTSTAHNLQSGTRVSIEGLALSKMNGNFKVTVTGSTTFTVPVDSTITNKEEAYPTTDSFVVGDYVTQGGYRWLVLSSGTYGTTPGPTLVATPGVISGNLLCVGTYTYTTQIWSPTAATTYFGPYIFDGSNGVPITKTIGTTTTAFVKGGAYRNVTVTVPSGVKFPDAPGYVCLGLGEPYQQTPVHYLGYLPVTSTSGTLILDPDYVFTQDVPTGSNIILLAQAQPFVPSNVQVSGIAFVTGGQLAHVYARNTINFIKGTGLDVQTIIVYPGSTGLANYDAGLVGYRINGCVYVWGDDNQNEVAAAIAS